MHPKLSPGASQIESKFSIDSRAATRAGGIASCSRRGSIVTGGWLAFTLARAEVRTIAGENLRLMFLWN